MILKAAIKYLYISMKKQWRTHRVNPVNLMECLGLLNCLRVTFWFSLSLTSLIKKMFFYLLSIKQQLDTVRDQLKNKAECLAGEESDISPRN